MKTKEIKKFRDTYKDYDKQCYFEGLKLAVLFDEKDGVKKWGGRWDADAEHWWMPEKHLTTDVHEGIGTVKDWLNDHKMIMGQYGKFRLNDHTENLFSSQNNDKYTEYRLEKGTDTCVVRMYFEQDVATFVFTGYENGDLPNEYLTIEDGRNRWGELIGIGYNRVENS